jgi:hypothetical protein
VEVVENTNDRNDTSVFSLPAGTPPQVVGVSVAKASVSETFAPVADSDAQLWTVRVPGVTTVSITFNRNDIETDEDALTIVSSDEQTTIAADDAGEISWSQDGYTATWTLDSEVSLGEWYIVLDATQVLTPVGTQLDHEWTNPEYFGDIDGNSEFPSGNGVAGVEGDEFKFAFTVLPGDANRDGDVDGIDLSNFADGWYGIQPPSWQYGDFDGDDDVDGTDLSIFAVGWYSGADYWAPPEQEKSGGGSKRSASGDLELALDALLERYDFGTPDESRPVEREDNYWNGFIDDFLGIYSELAA